MFHFEFFRAPPNPSKCYTDKNFGPPEAIQFRTRWLLAGMRLGFSLALKGYVRYFLDQVLCQERDHATPALEVTEHLCPARGRFFNLTQKQAVLGDGPYKGATFEHVKEGRLREWQDQIGQEAFEAEEKPAAAGAGRAEGEDV